MPKRTSFHRLVALALATAVIACGLQAKRLNAFVRRTETVAISKEQARGMAHARISAVFGARCVNRRHTLTIWRDVNSWEFYYEFLPACPDDMIQVSVFDDGRIIAL
jgi:predicted component of type VI protein secretion system